MPDERPTVKMIARRTGVSIGTVDRVLHGRAGVSAKTRERIQSLIVSLDYKPDILARRLKLNRNYQLRVLLPLASQDSGYWRLCRDGIELAAAELASNRVEVRIDEFDRYDGRGFRGLLDSLVEGGNDGLLVAPVLPEELLSALARLDPGFPYVFFDGSIEGSHPRATLGQDALRAGALAGRMLELLSPGGGPLLAINAHAEDRHIGLRIEGFRSYFASATTRATPDIIQRECFHLEDRARRGRFLSELFAESPLIKGILVANASGHYVGEWLVEAGLKKGVALLSWDLVPANEAALRSGAVDCVISQRPLEQGRLGLLRLFQEVAGEGRMAMHLDLPIDIWLKENLPASIKPTDLPKKEEHHGASKR